MSLRRFTWAGLLVAFVFGITTLWIRTAWPFAAFQAAILTMAAAWFALAAMKRNIVIEMSWWLMLPFDVAAIGAAQIAFGGTENRWQTRQTALEWMTHGCAAVLAFQVCRDERLKLAALKVFALGAGALALVSTLQNYSAPGRVLWLWDSGYQELVFGPFTYHTKLANFAELAIPVAVWLAIKERRGRGLYGLAAVALAGSVVAAASRGGMLVLLAEFAVLIAIAGRRIPLHLTLSVAGGLAAGIAVFGWELAARRWGANPVRDLRLPVMRSAWEMGTAFWPWGSGLGTWRGVYPAFASFDLHVAINQAHTDWLQWFAEGGVAWVAVMAAMLGVAVRSAKREWWTLGVVLVWLHGLFDYPMQQTPALASLVVAVWGVGLAGRQPITGSWVRCTGSEKLAPHERASNSVFSRRPCETAAPAPFEPGW